MVEWIPENGREKSYIWICPECERTVYCLPKDSRKKGTFKKRCDYGYCSYCGAAVGKVGLR